MGEVLAFGMMLGPEELSDEPGILLGPVSDWLQAAIGDREPAELAVFAYAASLSGANPLPTGDDYWTRSAAAELHDRGRLLAALRGGGFAEQAERLAQLGTPSTIPMMLVGPRGHVAYAVAKVHPLAPGGDA